MSIAVRRTHDHRVRPLAVDANARQRNHWQWRIPRPGRGGKEAGRDAAGDKCASAGKCGPRMAGRVVAWQVPTGVWSILGTMPRQYPQMSRSQPHVGALSSAIAAGCLAFVGFIPRAFSFEDDLKAKTLQLYQQGRRDFDAGRFEQSAQRFCLALESVPLPVLALWCARAKAQSGELVAATAAYLSAAELAPNELWFGEKQQLAKATAAAELDHLRARVPRLKILMTPKDGDTAEVILDSHALPPNAIGVEQPINPGVHWVELRSSKGRLERRLEVVEGETRVVLLDSRMVGMAGEPKSAGVKSESYAVASGGTNARRTLGWVGISLGAMGVLVGSVTGLMVYSRHDGMANDCVDGTCNPRRVTADQIDEYNQLRLTSSIGFISGGAFSAAGIVLLLTSPPREASSRVSIGLHSNGVVASGVF